MHFYESRGFVGVLVDGEGVEGPAWLRITRIKARLDTMTQATDKRIQQLTSALRLSPHPEGGFFRRVYQSEEMVSAESLPERFDGPRRSSTSIYYLLPGDRFSAFHRIKSDENWYHHEGCSLLLPVISPEGALLVYRLGGNLCKGDLPQITIPAGCWFGALPEEKDSYVLAGCNVSPGFAFEDFEMADQNSLLNEFPDYSEWIKKLTYGHL